MSLVVNEDCSKWWLSASGTVVSVVGASFVVSGFRTQNCVAWEDCQIQSSVAYCWNYQRLTDHCY